MSRSELENQKACSRSKLRLALSVSVQLSVVVFVLLLHGAVPGLLAPTLGQAIWTTGFAQSFANEGLFTIHASNFGIPEPAAMSFGLAGGWPASIFIEAGMNPIDAYVSMTATWLLIAYYFCFSLARWFGLSITMATLGALAWLTLPVTWAHANYSMLMLGIALLPFYFYCVIRFFCPGPNASHPKLSAYSWKFFWLLLVACVISVFMDGYSFMMFASGSALIALMFLLSKYSDIRVLGRAKLPGYVFCFGTAYALYAAYIGKSGFKEATLDFFRGWAVDLMYLLYPTEGVHWFWDWVGLSIPRSEQLHFGDASVWTTTFSAVLIAGAVLSVLSVKLLSKNIRFWVLTFGLISLFGFYMSLGPSLKIDVTKPQDQQLTRSMPARFGSLSTGSGLLSSYLPGFKNMRASYRWVALGSMGALLVILAVAATSRVNRRAALLSGLVLLLLIVSNLPDVRSSYRGDYRHRQMFLQIENEFVGALDTATKRGEKVAFLPWGNDFLVNYSAAKAGVYAFNIGGDKNLVEARKHWPLEMSGAWATVPTEDVTREVLELLATSTADVVVMTYTDLLWGAHEWPHTWGRREEVASQVHRLDSSGLFRIEDGKYFATIRLSGDQEDTSYQELLNQVYGSTCKPSWCFELAGFSSETLTEVGVIEAGELHSASRRGYLLYGPYIRMRKGKYQLTINGKLSHGSLTVDVVSDKGKTFHFEMKIAAGASDTGQLLQEEVELLEDVTDLEVRVFVERTDEVTIAGYDLEPIKGG